MIRAFALMGVACTQRHPAPVTTPTVSSETGTPPPTTFPAPVPGLPPTAVIEGAPELAFALSVTMVDDITGDGLDDIIAATHLEPHDSGVGIVLRDPLAGGAADERVGAIIEGIGEYPLQVSHAGDANRDGAPDLWWGAALYLGPFAGEYTFEGV